VPAETPTTTERSWRPAHRPGRHAPRRWIGRALYWLAVTAVSLVLVWLLLQVIHSYDGSTVGIITIGR
jgi:hypothetical protein